MSIDLTGLLTLIEGKPAFRRMVSSLQTGSSGACVPEAAKPFLIASVYTRLQRPVLVVTAQPEKARDMYEQLFLWCNSDCVRLFPEIDALPYQRVASDTTTESDRLQALASLVVPNGNPPLLITSIPSLLQKTVPYTDFASTCHVVRSGTKIDPMRLLRQWERMGYKSETMVEIPGTMSHRGGILDIYPPINEMPARLEFWGNSIESIRLYDPISQRSMSKVDSLTVCPSTELLTPLLRENIDVKLVKDTIGLSACTAEVCRQISQELEMLANGQRPRNLMFYAPLFNNDTILSYLPQNGVIIMDEPLLLQQAAEALDREAEELRTERLAEGGLPANYPVPYFKWAELSSLTGKHHNLVLAEFGTADMTVLNPGFTAQMNYGGHLPVFIDKIKQLRKQKKRVILTSFQASRLEELLENAGVFTTPVTEIKNLPPLNSLTLVQGSLAEGWILDSETYLFTDEEIFGFVKQRRFTRKRPVARHKLYSDFVPGNYVVHIEHGIAKFAGVQLMGSQGKEKEFLVLQYAAGDRLYVPTDQIDRVSRYIGSSERPPVLTRLGTQDWIQTKKRVKAAAENVARDLLALYAAREALPGFAYPPDNLWQQEFEASFPYVETADQLEAVERVKEDMEKPKPMDRLICGDVGYGKTEIAVRAAFKAATDSRQVAVLVPTTILAQQHYNTFSERMEAFPVKIEMLSRFRSPKEQKAVVEGLENGSVDICIGTHRLIQKDIKFKNLGLLIIDEEQRFGVAHKEYIKGMKQDVHVLTLSATPIPRTLHMALVGVRDMSTIETAPEDRLPIKTYIAEYDERLIREAILKEIERNGQVFFVHNRVQTIYQTAARLRALVPEAKISVGHGQMAEHELERVMADFIQGKSDVLVCSTIIESGLDMPRVNTLIVNRADKFGLTQLYQLRGRIGRGTNLAYAYFLYDKGKNISALAQKRLQTIYEATELGAGFGIAMKDLEIRGAGNILGLKQSGFISAVGFELYSRLLGEAVEELKAKMGTAVKTKPKIPELPPASVDLPLSALITEDYVSDVDTRLSLYQYLVKAADVKQVERLAIDFKDRFGSLPPEVSNLLYIVKIKLLATRAAIESISTEDGQIVLRRFQGMPFDQRRLVPFTRDGIKIGVTHLYLNPKRVKDWQIILEEIVKKITI